ncbi:MAG: glutamate-1-semialdehyde 2,1-aminomutase [Armatimonadota bacterium]|nr:glutamate-1-semialdehyde 2,1-aminomutase [Armatimonadota bacterium]MDR7432137.1 glutamate-1-semialdehyde 2,1-aminomutase [Armatimonadota bacterium]MDR7530306.1 glutamate-1-semialdehyde 2,1-aminomutase [Armatimonadota bacterium]MDR7599031.1 glutamate-1-semialdehyde 2,1-aminomutase [Armatimonadota bacterium]MDR7607511.1 glutamate-1-semialdehyde 2,1-aminomutase [Armatimonadota bacterium]
MTASEELFRRARRVMPGGVSSPVRAFRAVGGNPPFLVRGNGAYVEDADGRRYVDCVNSWGALILGHAHPAVVRAAQQAVADGSSFGAPTPWEVEFCERLCAAVPSVEAVRLVNSGTEAVMSALRVARAATGREGVVKFDGGYHGHADALLVRAGSGVATFDLPDSAGVPPSAVQATVSLPYNDLDAARAFFERRGHEIAAVLVEPVAGNMGTVPPEPGFLEGLRELTARYGALLVFDEVITGFRLRYGAAQEVFGVRADLTCLGKVIGGGFPLAAYGGRADLMRLVAPEGPVYQAGTLSGNPVAVRAGLATLGVLEDGAVYARLEHWGHVLEEGLQDAARQAGVEVWVNRVGSMLTVFFTPQRVVDYATARNSDAARFARFFHGMLSRGVYLPPSPFEAWFLSAAHGEQEVDRILQAARGAFQEAV